MSEIKRCVNCGTELKELKYYYDDDWGSKGSKVWLDCIKESKLVYCKKCGNVQVVLEESKCEQMDKSVLLSNEQKIRELEAKYQCKLKEATENANSIIDGLSKQRNRLERENEVMKGQLNMVKMFLGEQEDVE